MGESLLTPRQAAEFLSVGRTTLYLLTVPQGNLPFVRIGKRGIRYRREALQAWVDCQERRQQAATS